MVGTIDWTRHAHREEDELGVKTRRERLEWQLQNLKDNLQHPCAERVFQILTENGCDPNDLPHSHELVTSLDKISHILFLLSLEVEKDFIAVRKSIQEQQRQQQIIVLQKNKRAVVSDTSIGLV